jgi:hypothetical protein
VVYIMAAMAGACAASIAAGVVAARVIEFRTRPQVLVFSREGGRALAIQSRK